MNITTISPSFVTWATMNIMKTCKDCTWWLDGYCDRVDSLPDLPPETAFQIEADADDDSGLTAKLKTGPDFGCLHFQSKATQ